MNRTLTAVSTTVHELHRRNSTQTSQAAHSRPESVNALAMRYRLTTDEFAAQNLVESQTVRKQYSLSGSYFGVKPIRLPNRRLLWPDNTIEELLIGAGVIASTKGAKA